MSLRVASNIPPAFNAALALSFAGGILLAACAEESANTVPCELGTARTCRCDDGRVGSHLCLAEVGVYARCVCDGVHAGREQAGSASAPNAARAPDGGASATAANSRAAPGTNGSASMRPAPMGARDSGANPSGSPSAPSALQSEFGLQAEPQDEAVFLFDQTQLRTYDIRVNPADLAGIDQQPSAETWIDASLVFEGQTYGPYKFRYKGSVAAFGSPCTSNGRDSPKFEKCSFKLGFDEVDKEARFYGLRKLNFHAMNSDASYMRERLGYAMFREYGLAASRAVHVRVLINGVLDGLYIAVEQIDGRFTRARFGDGGEGNLYKEVWPVHDDPQRYLARLETNEDENPSVQIMLDLKAAIERSNDQTAAIVDLAYTARYIAVDRIIINDDGVFHFYCKPDRPEVPPQNHNFFWYESLAGDRLWLIPWDLDNSFDSAPWAHVSPEWNATAACRCNPVADTHQAPPTCDRLVSHFAMWTPEYNAEVDAFLAGPFAKNNVDAKLRAWAELIRPVIAEVDGLHAQPTEAEWAEALTAFEAKVDSARRNRGYPY